MKHTPQVGTISSATLRPEDLIPAFASELEYIVGDDPEYAPLLREASALQDSEDWEDEGASLVLEELFDALDSLAPAGVYFGSTEGDGADFGFWQSPPEPEDYVLSDSGPLGCRTSVHIVGGEDVGEYASQEEALAAVRERMLADQFFPSVWCQDDHGGLTLVHMEV